MWVEYHFLLLKFTFRIPRIQAQGYTQKFAFGVELAEAEYPDTHWYYTIVCVSGTALCCAVSQHLSMKLVWRVPIREWLQPGPQKPHIHIFIAWQTRKQLNKTHLPAVISNKPVPQGVNLGCLQTNSTVRQGVNPGCLQTNSTVRQGVNPGCLQTKSNVPQGINPGCLQCCSSVSTQDSPLVAQSYSSVSHKG